MGAPDDFLLPEALEVFRYEGGEYRLGLFTAEGQRGIAEGLSALVRERAGDVAEYCAAVYSLFAAVFGEAQAARILGEAEDLRKSHNALLSLMAFLRESLRCVAERQRRAINYFSPGRLARGKRRPWGGKERA